MILIPEFVRKSFSVVVAMAIVLTMSPGRTLARAEPGTPIGSLSAAGAVQLRGLDLSRTGTLFSGDTIRTSTGAYARLSMLDGQSIELGGNTRVDLTQTDARVEVAMHRGSLAFAAPRSSEEIRVALPSYEVLAPQGSSGEITFLDDGQVGIRTLVGSILVQSGEELIEIQEGNSQLLQPSGPQGPPAAENPALGSVADTIIWVGVAGLVGGIVAYQLLKGGDPASPSRPD